ncbi:hypothetical protein A4A49_47481 [Nicotiana attenuata]|uniref:Uncharacterized protein n=1 Tax=Nicotiana attenuata TaxID=49451 RepID=A0A1J6I2P4_NICAT|nr:hypothetical protein A4A49_47481 [Nicotiana attenuata]
MTKSYNGPVLGKDTNDTMVLIREGVLSTAAAVVSNCDVVRSNAAGVIEDTTAPNTTAPAVPIEDALKLDKGPPKPSRDVPASTVFARMYLATAGALQAAVDRAKISKVPGDVKQDKIDAGAADCATVLPGRHTSVGSALHNFNRAGFQASTAAPHKAVKPTGGTSTDAFENEKSVGQIATTKHVQGQGFAGVSVLDNTTDATLDKQTILKGTTVQNEGQEHEGKAQVGKMILLSSTNGATTAGTGRNNEQNLQKIISKREDIGKVGGQEKGSKEWLVVSPSKRDTIDQPKLKLAAENIVCTNSFDALTIEQTDGENHNGKKFELECGDTASKNGDNSSPRNYIKPSALGADIVDGLIPLQFLPGVLSDPTKGLSLQEFKGNNCMAGVGLNKSQHDIPSNELFDRSGNMLQVSNNQQTLSMISSATKKKGADVMSEADLSDESVQILNKLHEAISSTRKLWADQAVEYEEGEDYVGDSQE